MKPDRYARWKRTSHALGKIAPSLVATVQWLGRLDIQHSDEDRRFLDLSMRARASHVEMLRFSDHYTLSYLWVLEAYKVLHTIDECVRHDSSLLPSETHQLVRETEQVFEKMQLNAAKKQKGVDTCVFSPVLNQKHGIGWIVSPDVVITRQELSDTFLVLLERIQRCGPRSDIDDREEPRTRSLQAIRFVAERNTDVSALKGVTMNLSRSGLCMLAFHQLNEGQQIRIEQGPNVSNAALVCWVKKLDQDVFKVGLQLVS